MAANNTSTQCTKIPRFSSVQDGFRVHYMDLQQDGCRLAVAGYNDRKKETFIDLFTFTNNPDSQEKPLLMASRPFSKGFPIFNGLSWRYVCLLDDDIFVTGCDKTIESYNTKHGRVVDQYQITGDVRCMATRDERVYVSSWESCNVIVFDRMLNQINTITLKGIKGIGEDHPRDLTVNNNKLFICTSYREALMYNSNGDIEQEYKKPNQQYYRARSITVSEENGLVYILWWDDGIQRVVVVYSLPGGHSSLSGGQCLASFNVPDNSRRIRISDNVNRLFALIWDIGEVYEYHTKNIINLENLLRLLELLIDEDDCQKLIKYFKVPDKKAKTIIKSDESSTLLLQHLRKTRKISAGDISLLLKACNDQGISKVTEAWTNYQQFLSDQRKQLTEKLTDPDNDRQKLTSRLNETQLEKQRLTDRLASAEEQRKEVTDKLKEADDVRLQLTKRLEVTEGKQQQLVNILNATEEEKKQFTDRLRVSDDERQQLTGRLEATEEKRRQYKDRLEAAEEERRQYKDRLEATEEERRQYKDRLEATEDEKKQLTDRLSVSDDERQQLTGKLEATEEERRQYKDRLSVTEEEKELICDKEKILKRIVDDKQQELEETKSSLRVAKDELVKSQLEYAKESMALQEVLKQTREALNREVTSIDSLDEEHSLPKENKHADISNESALAVSFGRLMVDVAEDLTLDSTLRLAYLFGLPRAESDMLRRISLVETPGITLINLIKKRNIINLYDVTNLQKGLMHLQLNSTNEKHLVPYQEKIDTFQFEENRSPDLLDWPDEKAEAPKADETSLPQESLEKNESEEYKHDDDDERLMEKIEREELPSPRQDSQTLQIRQRHPYIEHKINYEGGTITVMGVHLSIPDKALSSDHVIGVTVVHDPGKPLPGSARRGRMTPLIKLEPEGIKLNKPACLTIPHSAIIPEPDRHGVIVFTGQTDPGDLHKGEITWTEEKSLKWKLEQEKISLYIDTLSYVFVNLVSQETEQKHMFRVVPFIDGILDSKDDVLITVCFCKDNDDEYKLLLEDHQSKLTLGHYTTFQINRTLNEGIDTVSDVELTMSSQGDSYHLTKTESAKLVYTDHLCAASRVSHQFRLKRSKDGNTDMVDVKLKVSQGKNNKISLFLQSKVKNILLSPESQILLYKELPKELHQYETLKETVARLLDKHHCEKLSMFFDLKPAEKDKIRNDARPGTVLMKILDERELIKPDKMIDLYEGLKANHLNKVARHVLEYIEVSKKETMMESGVQKDNKEKVNEKEEVPQGRDLKMNRNAKLLVEEGYKRLDVQRALKLSHGKLDLGRRLLLLAKDEHERVPLFPGSALYKEQYIDEHGGELTISGIHLLVPAGALLSGRIVSLRVSAESDIKGPISNRSLRLIPFVRLGPEKLTFQKPVVMIIQHCAFITSNQTGLDVYSGVPLKDKTIKWTLERKHFSCSMSSNNLQIEIQRPACGLIGPHIPYQSKMRKRVCVIPIMKRISNSDDELTICLWIHNDDQLEHDVLINEEVYNNKGIAVHDPVYVVLTTMGSTLPVSISSSTSQCSPYPRRVEIDMNTLWLQNRHKVVFHLQNKGTRDTVNLEIESRYGVFRNILFQLNIQLKIEELLRTDQTTSPLQHILPEFIIESFNQLIQKVSENLDAEESTQLANIFKLPHDVISSMEKLNKPGAILLETLAKKSLISPTNISAFENALTEQGNEECTKLVRKFRMKNHVVQATMCPEENV